MDTYLGDEQKRTVISDVEQELQKMHRSNRDMVFDFYTEYLQDLFVTYHQERLTKMFGENFLQHKECRKLVHHKEDLNSSAWDLI